jgi:hypothetical protein
MADITVRKLEGDEKLQVMYGLNAYAFHAAPPLMYGTHDPDDFAIRGWGNPSPAVQAIMRAMFPPMTPYLHEYF